MTQYKYGTILEAKNDGKPPNDNIEKGDITIQPGKVDTDKITYITEDNDIAVIAFDPLEIYEADRRMNAQEAIEFAKERWTEE